MKNPSSPARIERRDFWRVGGASAAALGAAGGLAPGSETAASPLAAEFTPATKYPKLAMITTYSPQKLALATPAGYEGVVIQLDDFFDPDKLSDAQINQVLAASRDAGARIISIECMWGLNHIDPSTAERTRVHARFIRCLEFAHRLGCKFVGTFSGGVPRGPGGRAVHELCPAGNRQSKR